MVKRMTDKDILLSDLNDISEILNNNGYGGWCSTIRKAVDLLKEQEAMNVDAFVQWCIDNHIMGDATVRGIKYWVGKYKENSL